MNTWIILQIAFDLFVLAAFFYGFIRLRMREKEDPRIVQGLRLLQTKISILQDLSDKTDTQSKQVLTLMDRKLKEVQAQFREVDKHIAKVDTSIQKSLEVANIFQDKIPHEEILERKTTSKYIRAAQLAFKGKSLEEISQEIDLPRGELDLIVKLNSKQLMFNEDSLPEWLKHRQRLDEEKQILATPQLQIDTLQELGNEFRKACVDFEENKSQVNKSKIDEIATQANQMIKNLGDKFDFSKGSKG